MAMENRLMLLLEEDLDWTKWTALNCNNIECGQKKDDDHCILASVLWLRLAYAQLRPGGIPKSHQ
jgi:hypothetical protein